MATLFDLACNPEFEIDWENFMEKAQLKGWIITGVDNLDMGDPDEDEFYDRHCKFLCDHNWRDVKALAATVTHCHYIAQTVMPLYIYNGRRRTNIGEDDDPEEYYDDAIPRIQFVHGGDAIASQSLEAMIPPLSGKTLKELALQNKMVSLTYLSGEHLKDEDAIVAPSIDNQEAYQRWHGHWEEPECPGAIVFNCERARKTRLRGKQNPMNGYRPY